MPQINPNASRLIDEYISDSPPFAQKICKILRKTIHQAVPHIIEDWKWGPNFNHNGMVCGLKAFKEHVSLIFFKGVYLKDEHKILIHGQRNMYSRTVKFYNAKEIDCTLLIEYIIEAAELNENNIESKVERKKLTVPADLQMAIISNVDALVFFQTLSYTYRKTFIDWVENAKRNSTRMRRIRKTVAMLSKGIKLSDKYIK